MRNIRFTTTTDHWMIKKHGAEQPVAEYVRSMPSPTTFYKFEAKYEGVEMSDIDRVCCRMADQTKIGLPTLW
jgi:hypothetical protein